MNIGFLASQDDERCPISHLTLRKYLSDGFEVLIEENLGKPIGQKFDGHELSRQELLEKAEVICSISPPAQEVYEKVSSGTKFISFYQPFTPGYDEDQFHGNPVEAFSLDMVPRSSLAQTMDALSAMASIAGYKAVLLAAGKLPRLFPMMMTAAGAIRPANVLIIGAGVAGLQAIATARKLGARVEAFDVRAAVKEEVQSLGASFVEVEGATEDAAAGGYAVEQSDDFKRRQKEAISDSVAKSDVVITTAQIRGKTAPILVTKEMVERMSPGSVIIDMASSTGGNCELVEDNKEIFHNDVRIIGDSKLFLQATQDASDLLSNIIYNYSKLMVNDGNIEIDKENPILSDSLIYSGI